MKKSAIAAIISAITFAGTMGCDGVDGGTVSEDAILEELDESELPEFAAPESEAEEDKSPFETSLDFTNEVDPSAACLMCEDYLEHPCNTTIPMVCWWVSQPYCFAAEGLVCKDGIWQYG